MDQDDQHIDLAIRNADGPEPDRRLQAASLLLPKSTTQAPPAPGLRRRNTVPTGPDPTARLEQPQAPQPEAPAAASVRPPQPKPRARSRLGRLGKCLAAVALLSIGGAALLTNARYITSDNAVVTAHVVSLRTPIEGFVATNAAAVGNPVAAGAVLAEITNPRADDRQVKAMRASLVRLRAELDAAQQEQASLTSMLGDLTERATRHRAAKLAQLTLDIARIDRDRAARQQQLEQLVRDMRRKVTLRGTVSQSDIETAETAVRVAAAQVASFDQQINVAQAEARSTEAGVLTELNSGNDVAYSEQRADELRVRLAELTRTISTLRAASAETQDQLAAETATLERVQAATISVPSPGMIWRLGAAPGERVAPGDLLAQIVDCGAAFLAVAVPQDRLPDIDLKAVATFRLAGEKQERTGPIVAITGEFAVRGDASLATVPAAGTNPVAAVLVAVTPSPNKLGACLVGRTARVLLPASGGGWLDWAMRRLPLWLATPNKPLWLATPNKTLRLATANKN
jgi:multidrug resistance efflux pump